LTLLVVVALTAAVASVAALASSNADPGITSRVITIGGTFPLSGPASSYAPIPVGMRAYFSYANATRRADGKRGVHGRQIKWIYYDDGYNPANTVQQTRKLVESDKVFALFGGLGTEPQQAVRNYLNDQKVPQMFVSTGATEFGSLFTQYPYTMGWQPDYQAEGAIYGKYIVANQGTKKIAVILQNDSYGNDYLNGLKAGLGANQSNIISTQRFEVTAPSVGQQVAAPGTDEQNRQPRTQNESQPVCVQVGHAQLRMRLRFGVGYRAEDARCRLDPERAHITAQRLVQPERRLAAGVW